MVLLRRLAAAFILIVSCSALFGADRINGAVDTTRTVVLKGHIRPEAQPQNDVGLADPGTEIAYATLLLTLDPSIESFLEQQQTPGSPNYRRWLTPEQFGDRFGLSKNDLAKLTGWLESQGLKINDVARGRHWITFSGTAEKMGRALGTEIHNYRVNGEMHFANSTNPSIPDAFQGVIGGFRGLDNFPAQSMVVKSPKQPDSFSPENNSGTNHFLTPDDLATIFNIKALYDAGIDGTGQTLVIAGETDLVMSDFKTFQSRYGIAPNLPQLMLFGPDPGIRSDLIEADLDLEWSTAVARNATIVYAYATNVFTAAQYAVDQNLGQQMSISYGGCEPYESVAYRAIAQQANAQGMTIFVSSGDAGAATCDRFGPVPLATHGATASWPSSFPEITSVGGTELNDSGGIYWAKTNSATGASALSYIPEVPWNDSAAANSLEGGGGAPSILFSKPSWQTGPGVPNDGMRDLPDISLPASPFKYAYLVESNGNLGGVGGTSASSPAWAGIAALLNQYLTSKGIIAQPGLGNINPALYRLAQATTDVFHDITTGDNKVPCEQSSPDCIDGMVGFAAGVGYDLATGLGSVDVFKFVTEWNSGTASATSVTSSPAGIGLSDVVTLTATVQGGGVSPTGAVDFIVNDVDLGTAVLAPGAAGTSIAMLSVTGSQIAIGSGTVTALYSGDGVYTGSEGSASVTVTIPPTKGSVVVPWVTPNPVFQVGANAWPYTAGLTEKNGVATTLTGFTINGVNNLSGFANPNIPANGTIRANFQGNALAVPLNRVYVFSGKDADGTTWTQSITIPFVGPASGISPLNPAMSLTTTTPVVFVSVPANPYCQWAQELTVQETGGFQMVLTKLTVAGNDLSSVLSQIFGTTRLAPYGMLQGLVCFDDTTAPGSKTYVLTATLSDGQLGGSLAVVLATNFSTTLAKPALVASPQSVTLSVTDASPLASASVDVQSSNATGSWTASVLPKNRATTWLTLPASGSGPVKIQASGAGLSPGVYSATVAVTLNQSAVTIPVTLTVNPSAATMIAGVVNNFSGSTIIAPGEMAAVFGAQMGPPGSANKAPRLPLPFSLAGVSATVNGVSAPMYYVSPGQIDLQIPYETGAGPATLAINNNGQIAAFPMEVASAAPGLFTGAFDARTGKIVSTATPAQVLVLYITGEGDVTPTLASGATPALSSSGIYPQPRQQLTVTIGGIPAQILFAGIPNGLAAATQINVVVPSNAPPGPQPVIVTVGGGVTQSLMLTINSAQ